jgi:hypothetical protein
MRWNLVLARGDGHNVCSDSKSKKGKSERNVNSIHLLDIPPHPEHTVGAHQWLSFVWLYSIAATWARISIQKGWYSNLVYAFFSSIYHYVLHRLLFSSSCQVDLITVAIAEIKANSLWKFDECVGIRWQYAIKSNWIFIKDWNTQTHTHTHSHTYHKYNDPLQTYTHARAHTHTHNALAHTHIHTHTHMHTRIHTHNHTNLSKDIPTRPAGYWNNNTHTHTHTHIHTHTKAWDQPSMHRR